MGATKTLFEAVIVRSLSIMSLESKSDVFANCFCNLLGAAEDGSAVLKRVGNVALLETDIFCSDLSLGCTPGRAGREGRAVEHGVYLPYEAGFGVVPVQENRFR